MSNQIIFNQQQIDQLNLITSNGQSNFANGYHYISEQLVGTSASNDIQFWFENAAAINENQIFSAASTFIRSVTQAGRIWDSLGANTLQELQDVSDAIGRNVIDLISDERGVPSLEVI